MPRKKKTDEEAKRLQEEQEMTLIRAAAVYKYLMDSMRNISEMESEAFERVMNTIFTKELMEAYGLLSYEDFTNELRYEYTNNDIKKYIKYFYENANPYLSVVALSNLKFALWGVQAMFDTMLKKEVSNLEYDGES